MKNLFYHRSRMLGIAVSVCLTLGLLSPYAPKSLAAEETKSDAASQIRMAKMEGDVEVVDSVGKELVTTENMRLFTGNHVKTKEKSYAFFNLDDAKAVKLDAASDAEIRESGKKMEILLKNGGLMLDVKEPVATNARVNVRTSSMVMGIRGTDVYAKKVSEGEYVFGCLEGSSNVTLGDLVNNEVYNFVINSGEKIVVEDGDVSGATTEPLTVEELPGFVLYAVATDPELAQRIYEKNGMDLRDVTVEDALAKMTEEEKALAEKIKTFTENLNKQKEEEKQDIVWAGIVQEVRRITGKRTPTTPSTTPPPNTPETPSDQTPSPVTPSNDTGGGSEGGDEGGDDETTKYNITINTSGKGGKVVADKESAAEGDTVTLTVTLSDNYKLDDLSVVTDEEEPSSVSLDTVTKNKEYSFKMPAHGVTVNASFEKEEEEETEYKVTVNSSEGGTVKASPSKAAKGEEITLKVTPDENYELDSITATKENGKKVSLTKASDSENRTFEMPASDVTVEATFKEKEKEEEEETKYTVTVNSGEGGSVETDSTSATEGTKITLTVTPSQNYELDSISATAGSNEVSLTKSSDGTSYSFEMPASDVTVTASFKKSVYSLTWTVSGDGGDFTCDKPSTAEAGSTVSVAYQVSRGYEAKVTVNGTELGETDKSFEMPAKNTEVVLTLTALTPVHISLGNHYIMAASDKYPKMDISENPEQGDAIEIDVPFTYNGTEGNSETVLYKGDVISFDTSKIANLRESAAAEYEQGVDGYTFNSLKYNETTVNGDFTMPDSDVTISVVYERLYSIDYYDMEEYGEIDCPSSAKAGEKVTFTFLPFDDPVSLVAYYYGSESAASADNTAPIDKIYPSTEDGTTYSFEMPASYVELGEDQ